MDAATTAPVTGRTVPKGRAYYSLILFTIIYSFAVLDRNVINLTLESIKTDLGFSDTQMGLVAGLAFSGMQLIFGLPAARWADTGDRRIIMTLAISFWSLMTMLCGLAHNGLMFVLGRIGVGIGESTGPAYHSFISDLFDKHERGRAIAIYALGTSVSMLIGFPIIGMIHEHWGWRAAFLIAGAPALLLAAVVFFTIRDPRKDGIAAKREAKPTPSIKVTARTLLERKSYLFVVAGFCIGGFGSSGFGVWGPTFLARVHDLSPSQIGASVGLISGIAGISGGLIGGMTVDLMSRRFGDAYKIVPFAFTATLMAPMILLTAFSPWLSLSLAGMGALAFLNAFEFAPVIAAVQTILPSRMRATGSALNGFIGALIALGLGPVYIGFLNDKLAPVLGPEVIKFSLASAAFFCLVGAGCFWMASRYVARDIARSEAE